MTFIPDIISPGFLIMAAAVTLFAGFVKGAVGFGMPMIMISGLGSFLSPEIALAALIVPTVLSNGWQAIRGGALNAWQSVVNYRLYIGFLLVMIVLSAQLVRYLSVSWLFLIIGIPVTFFAITQLTGWHFTIRPDNKTRSEVFFGTIAGFLGGLTGVWGPPTIAFLTALNTPKNEHVQVQGVIYGAGAVVLFISHLKSGLLSGQSLQLSLWMVIPAMLGMTIGFWIQDRLDQEKFRRATLVVLILAGLNLIRRGLVG